MKRTLTPEATRAATRLNAVFLQRKSETGLSQQKAADQLGWTQGAVHQYLTGKTPLNAAALKRLCTLLDADPESIYPELMEKYRWIVGEGPGHIGENAERYGQAGHNIRLLLDELRSRGAKDADELAHAMLKLINPKRKHTDPK